MRSRQARIRARLGLAGPAPTIRLKLTATYGLVFLITGAVLLTIGYALVRHNISSSQHFRAELQKLGLVPPRSPRPLLFAPGSEASSVADAVRAQLVSDSLHRLVVEYTFALGVMTMIAVGTGWLLAGRALRPLREITATARRVSGENLGERIGLSGPADELKELADTFDGMLGRLDAAFASQRHFVANASHELRTPLAIMRTEVDVALADPDADKFELRSMGEAVRETIDRCERLIESLLVLARSEAAAGREEVVDLGALAADCITDLHGRADAAGVRIDAELEPACTRGDPNLLERMIANLIDNGIRHNEPDGHLQVNTRTHAGRIELTVANGGPVIDPVEAQSLSEPFRRLGRSFGGFGLGLSIVRSVAAAHHGTTEIKAPPTGGLEVLIVLPASPAGANVVITRTSSALTQS
jgi:signal transduction histidine kinase